MKEIVYGVENRLGWFNMWGSQFGHQAINDLFLKQVRFSQPVSKVGQPDPTSVDLQTPQIKWCNLANLTKTLKSLPMYSINLFLVHGLPVFYPSIYMIYMFWTSI